MDDAPGELFQHRLGAIEILGLTADHGEQRAGLHLRDGAEHRRLDQPRTARFDRRRKLAAGHRLQRAHLDEQLALDVAFEEPAGPANILRTPWSSVMLEMTTSATVATPRALAAMRSPSAASALGLGALVPARHVKSLLAQTAGYCRAHAAEADNAEFHNVLPLRRTFGA